MGRLLLSLLLGGGLFALIAWQLGLVPLSTPEVTEPPPYPDARKAETAKLDLGSDLYESKAAPAPEVPGGKEGWYRDPVVVQGHMNVMDKMEVPSQLTGQLLFVGEEVPEGAAQVAGIAAFMAEPYQYATMSLADQERVVFYRRIYEGQEVGLGQMVAKLDPSKLIGELAIKGAKVNTALADSRAGEAAHEEATRQYEKQVDLLRQRASSPQEVNIAKLTMIKYREEAFSKKVAIQIAEKERDIVEIILRQHEIRNKIPLDRSIVKQIYRSRGEAVKENEPVLQLYSMDRLLAEGLLDLQFVSRLRPGQKVTIEPSQEEPPLKVYKAHFGEVTAVAAVGNGKEPRFVTASDDGYVCLWSRYETAPLRELRHPKGVKSLACSPPGAAENLCLAGLADGSIWVWDLNDAKNEPKVRIADKHAEAVSALAFSPDGVFFASGGTDSRIFLWRTADGGLTYPFDPEHGAFDRHGGTITSLHFTPQCQLISASTDQTVRVWSLKEKGAVLQFDPIAGRTGAVPHLGVSADPNKRWMLFERGKDLQILSALDGRKITTLQNPTGNPFETLAIFSPDASLLLTAGGAEGRMQLWSTPTATRRGFEVRQWVTQEASEVTCAAFSPWAGRSDEASFAVTGNKRGYVYLWGVPTAKQVQDHPIRNVPLTLIGQSLDASSRQVRIGAMVANPAGAEHPGGRLLPGRPVTIVID